MPHRRDWLGEWVAAAGLLLPTAHYVRPPKPDTELPMRCYLSVGPATSGIAAAVMVGEYSRGRWWMLDKWRRDNREAAPRRTATAHGAGVMPRERMAESVAEWAAGAPAVVIEAKVDEADPNFADLLRAEFARLGLVTQIPAAPTLPVQVAG